MIHKTLVAFVGLFALGCFGQHAVAGHRLVVQGNNKLAIVGEDGKIQWQMKWGGIHDIHVLRNGHIMVQQGSGKVAEIDPDTKSVVWSYDSTKQNGNQGKRIEVHAFQPLPDGKVMIAESGVGRIIEVDRDGKLLKEVKLKINKPHPHRDTRLVRKLVNGNYLVCHEGDGAVREYDGETGKVVWDYDVPLFGKEPRGGHGIEAFGNQAFAAVRLTNGNTLIATGKRTQCSRSYAREEDRLATAPKRLAQHNTCLGDNARSTAQRQLRHRQLSRRPRRTRC